MLDSGAAVQPLVAISMLGLAQSRLLQLVCAAPALRLTALHLVKLCDSKLHHALHCKREVCQQQQAMHAMQHLGSEHERCSHNCVCNAARTYWKCTQIPLATKSSAHSA